MTVPVVREMWVRTVVFIDSRQSCLTFYIMYIFDNNKTKTSHQTSSHWVCCSVYIKIQKYREGLSEKIFLLGTEVLCNLKNKT